MSALAEGNRANTPLTATSPPLGEETANVEPHSTLPTEIAFEPQNPNGGPAIQTPTEPPWDKPTPTPKPSQTTVTVTVSEPKMGDTRIVDGQKQVYFLGFGWIEDNDTPNEVYYAEDMYENGNKIDIMGSDGDIDKMLGTMD